MKSTLKLPELKLKDFSKMPCGSPGDGRENIGHSLFSTFISCLFFFFFLPGSSGLGSASSIQAAVRQLEAEADAIIQMVREGQRARRQQQAATVSMMPVAPHSFVSLPFPTTLSVGFHCPYLVCFCIKFAV